MELLRYYAMVLFLVEINSMEHLMTMIMVRIVVLNLKLIVLMKTTVGLLLIIDVVGGGKMMLFDLL